MKDKYIDLEGDSVLDFPLYYRVQRIIMIVGRGSNHFPLSTLFFLRFRSNFICILRTRSTTGVLFGVLTDRNIRMVSGNPGRIDEQHRN